MSISIVMLTYNNYEKVLRSMTSMFYFITEPKIKEFIILDNGSYQHELKVFLKQLERQIDKLRIIWSNKNLGIAKGRKILFDVAEGEYIASFDSDIVIINPPLFLEVFYKALDIPNMMLVGGGGGDHVYFPSLERENIDNKDSPDSPNELKPVEEVAGWFHGFKSKILTKHGGEIEMDERFSPFWAEDSDFCMQIRMVGGKCCIMGKGIVAHQWSSCDKKETQITLEDMWNVFQDKWYEIFGKDFIFNIDEDFYDKNYPQSKSMKRNREYYYKIGMIEGHFYSKEPINLFFNNVKFSSETEIEIIDKKEKISIPDFDFKYFTYENIVKNNYKILHGNIPKRVKDLIVLTVFNTGKCIDILKSLISFQRINIVICLTDEKEITSIENFLKKYSCNYLFTIFPNLNFDLIPYIINVKELSKKINFENVLNLSTERDNSEYLLKPLEIFKPGYFLETQLEKIDKFNMSFIDQVLNFDSNMMWNKDCIFYESGEYLNNLFNSYPVEETLLKCLKIPKKYNNYVSPRCSPKHSLERILGYLKPIISKEHYSYFIVICEINNELDLKKIKGILSNFNKGEICIFNKGNLKKINLRDLGVDYYSSINKNIDRKEIYINGLENINFEKFSNIVFCDCIFEIEENISEFFKKSRFKNLAFLEDKEKINLCLFSILFNSIPLLYESIKKQDFDFSNFLKKITAKVLWKGVEEEINGSKATIYHKSGFHKDSLFPLSFY